MLLTGGASRRLAADKARLLLDGETLAARAARVLSAVCDRAVEVGPGVSDLPAVREDPPGRGPLAALVAGTCALGDPPAVVLLACDMPFVDVPLVELLARWPGRPGAVPVAGGRPQYVCARYGRDALRRAADAVCAGRSSLRELVDLDLAAAAGAAYDVDLVPEEAWRAVAAAHAFDDVDTPDDLLRLGLS